MSESQIGVQSLAVDHAEICRGVIGLAALIGATSAAIGTIVSYLAGVGETPGFLFGRSAYLSTLLRWRGLPFEFLALAWFASVLVGLRGDRKSAEHGLLPFVFVSAIPAAGLSVWLATAGRGPSWMAILAAFASLAILLTAALGPQLVGAQLGRRVASLVRSPRAWVRVLGVLAFVLISAQALRMPIQAVSSSDAQALSFRRWYAGQPRSAIPQLATVGLVKVVAFTDYKCPYCASALPSIEATISKFRSLGVGSVELVIRDYPLEPACNPALEKAVHPGACLIAAAVRFVSQQRGNAAGHEFASWCYRNVRNVLSDDAVWDQLRRLGLAEGLQYHLDSVMAEVRTDAIFGETVGVRGTPAVFVNGIKIPGVMFLDDALRFEAARNTASGK